MAAYMAFLAVVLLPGLSRGLSSPEPTPAIDLLISPLSQDEFFRSIYNRDVKIFRHDPAYLDEFSDHEIWAKTTRDVDSFLSESFTQRDEDGVFVVRDVNSSQVELEEDATWASYQDEFHRNRMSAFVRREKMEDFPVSDLELQMRNFFRTQTTTMHA